MPLPPPIAILPAWKAVYGTVAKRRLFLLLLGYSCLALLGFYIASPPHDTTTRIFGLGLIFPGAGFLTYADFTSLEGWLHIGMVGLGIIGFLLSVVVWFATGNVLAPPIMWLLLAIGAASMPHLHCLSPTPPFVALGLASGMILVLFLKNLVSSPFRQATRTRLNHWLAEEAPGTLASFKPQIIEETNELSLEDIKRQRFLLDRALQPLDQFDGFEWLDQFQTAAVRYQLNFAGYALSMAQYNYFPAFGAYFDQAQHNLILKMADHRIWRYWSLENLWGNLRLDANPIHRENIMYTGFVAAQMAMYHAASSKYDFDKANSFILNHPSGKKWSYNLNDLLHGMTKQMDASPYHLMACEPNWIYPLCNMIGASAIQSQMPDVWARQEARFRHHLETEFIDWQGRIIACRSRYTGLSFPMIGGAMPQAMPSFFMNAILPDIALRQWLLLRQQIMDGNQLKRDQVWRIDTGNYRFSRASAYAAIALAASEIGDDVVRNACLNALEEECPTRTDDGYFYRPKSSVWAHAVEHLARSTRPNSFRSLIHQPHRKSGAYIADASYPDILVASARTEEDKLRAVFYSGNASGIKKISLAGLHPHTIYHVYAQKNEKIMLKADAEGKANVRFIVDGRTEWDLRKAE